MDKAMYILLNEKLTKSQRIPQAAHAAAEFMGEYGQDEDIQDWLHNHRYIICLQASEETMRRIAVELHQDGKTRFKPFIDSDFPPDFGWTAAAFEPMTREEGRKYFAQLRLA